MNHTSITLNVVQDGYYIDYGDNILARIVDIKNFSLIMVIFFGSYYPLGNIMVGGVYKVLQKMKIVKPQLVQVKKK